MKLMRFSRPDSWSWPAANQLSTLREEINRLFESPFGNGRESEIFNTWAPALDLYEDKDHLVVRTEIPGMEKEEINISLHDGTLTVSGERKSERKVQDGEISRSERVFGKFQRSIALPKKVDPGAVKASYKDGVLTVTLPKAEEAKPRQIEIKAN